MGPVAEAAAVFVVDVENEKPQIGAGLDDLLQQQRNRARFADTGGAEHGKMLAHHFVDVEAGGDGGVELQMPDVDHARAAGMEDQAQLARGDKSHRVADRRIGGDAALEARGCGIVIGDFSDELQLRRRDELILRGWARLQGDVGDQTDEQRFIGAHAEEFADRRPRFLGAVGSGAGKPDAGMTAADRIDLTQESDLRHRLSPY